MYDTTLGKSLGYGQIHRPRRFRYGPEPSPLDRAIAPQDSRINQQAFGQTPPNEPQVRGYGDDTPKYFQREPTTTNYRRAYGPMKDFQRTPQGPLTATHGAGFEALDKRFGQLFAGGPMQSSGGAGESVQAQPNMREGWGLGPGGQQIKFQYDAGQLGGPGQYRGNLEGFNTDKFDPNHPESSSLKVIAGRIMETIDPYSPNAVDDLVAKLNAAGIRASKEGTYGDLVRFLDTGEVVDVMRNADFVGGKEGATVGWAWMPHEQAVAPEGAPEAGLPYELDPLMMSILGDDPSSFAAVMALLKKMTPGKAAGVMKPGDLATGWL